MSKSASGVKKYYSEEYYREGQSSLGNYYSENDQVIGKWGGKGAEILGLKPEISKADFAALCDNQNPITGSKMTARTDKDRTIGYDFTWNCPKTVSIAFAFGNDADKADILQVFKESVTDAMCEVEKGMQTRVRKGGKNENRESQNILYGEFTHFSTRPIDGTVDMHLHSHCFVQNQVYCDVEQVWKAGQFKQIKQDAPYYEAYFHNVMAEKLIKLGYGINRSQTGYEIAGIDKETIAKFSRRTNEIEEHAKELGITDDRQKNNLGALTRESKRVIKTDFDQHAEWLNRLTDKEKFDLQNLRNNYSSDDNADTFLTAKKAVEIAINHHLERKSVVSDKEVLATAMKVAVNTASAKDIINEFKAKEDVFAIKENLRTFITTKDALSEEKQLINSAMGFRNKFSPVNPHYVIGDNKLNKDQTRAVKTALNDTNGITVIAGKAGTGKTTLMKEVQLGIEQGGKKIFAFAPSSEASRMVQRSEGFENADTVAALLINKENHSQYKNQVIWIDEAGMLSNKDMNGILKVAKQQNARVILSGDIKQHNSVERGDALRILQKYSGINSVGVNKIQRQLNEDYRGAVKLLAEANIDKGFKKLEHMGVIHEITDSKERISTIAKDYFESSFKNNKTSNVLVIAPTHAEGDAVTKEIRSVLKQNNKLDADDKTITMLKAKQFTEVEKQNPEKYCDGDVLCFHQNIRGVKAGSKLELLERQGNVLKTIDSEGKEYAISTDMYKNFNVFEKKEIAISKGEKIRITNNGKTNEGVHLFNGTCYEVKGFDKLGNIKLSNGSVIDKNFGHIAHGYVMTSHSSQGKTADKVIISQSSMSFRASSQEQFYVSVSRGKQATAIYTDDKESLLHAVSQSVHRISATELMEKMKVAAIDNGKNRHIEMLKDRAKQAMNRVSKIINKGK